MLDKFIESEPAKPILNKYFVVAHLELGKGAESNEGADKVLAKYFEDSGGVPAHAFLDKEGKLIVNSVRDKEGNIGYPFEPEEIGWFMTMLKKAAPGMSAAESEKIETALHDYRKAKKASQG